MALNGRHISNRKHLTSALPIRHSECHNLQIRPLSTHVRLSVFYLLQFYNQLPHLPNSLPNSQQLQDIHFPLSQTDKAMPNHKQHRAFENINSNKLVPLLFLCCLLINKAAKNQRHQPIRH